MPTLPQRRGPAATLEVTENDLHPDGIPMPRRYLLDSVSHAECMFSHIQGACFTRLSQLSNGLSYRALGRGDSGLIAVDNHGTEPQPRKARGPLRWVDWMDLSVAPIEKTAASPLPSLQVLARRLADAPAGVIAESSQNRTLRNGE